MAKHGTARVAIIGAGLGGTAAASLLQQAGYDAIVYEQAPRFSRLGAGIHVSPNVTHVMRRIGIEKRLREIGLRPQTWKSRDWDTGAVSFDFPLGDTAEARYGAPYLILHRGDYHAELMRAVKPGTIRFSKRLIALDQDQSSVRMRFADGTEERADLVIGADGVNSMVREILLGPEKPIYTGYIAHRSIFPRALLGDMELDDCTKWWSDDRHIVVYYLTGKRDEVYFVTGVPQEQWPDGVPNVPGSLEQLRADFDGYEPRVQKILAACPAVSNWPLLEREPLPLWSRGRVVILGDACHPMKPHMAQGAGMAVEDAAMLLRCLEEAGPDAYEIAFQRYEASRIERTSRVQKESHDNVWLRWESDPGWCFGYNVWSEPIRSSKPKAFVKEQAI